MNYNVFMYKIIVSDLDETLLNGQKHISKADIESISKLTECKFIIATGRGFGAVQHHLKEIGQYNKQNSYTMSYNGGIITENKDNRILYAKYMPFEDAKFLFNLGKKYNICINLYCEDRCYIYKLFENERILLSNNGFDLVEFEEDNIDFAKDFKIVKLLFCSEDYEYLKFIKKDMNIDDRFSISFSSQRYIELNPLGIDKGFGLRKLCELLDVDIKDTIAVGDNINDIEMIKAAGIGIGVKNTVPEVVPHCDTIIDADNNHDPISYIINKYNIK